MTEVRTRLQRCGSPAWQPLGDSLVNSLFLEYLLVAMIVKPTHCHKVGLGSILDVDGVLKERPDR